MNIETLPRYTLSIALILFVLAAGSFGPSVVAQEEERFRGTFSTQARRGASLTRFNIRIAEYTSDEEMARLKGVLVSDGRQGLENALLDSERGRFQIAGGRGENIGFARTQPTGDGGRIITLITARPLDIVEERRATRSRDFAFGLIQLQLDENDEGDGIIQAASRIEIDDDDQIVIESFGNSPFSVLSVEPQ